MDVNDTLKHDVIANDRLNGCVAYDAKLACAVS